MNALRSIALLASMLCGAWPTASCALDVEEGSRERLIGLLQGKGDVLKRTVERIGNRTIQIRLIISAEAEYAYAKKILSEHRRYREWALRNINVKANGSSYFVKFLGCDPLPSGVLVFPIRIDLPLFGRDMTAYISIRTENVQGGFAVHAKTTTDEHPQNLGNLDGYLYFFQAPKEKRRVFGELRGNLQLTNGLLYEALPERLLIRETSERIQTLLENYRDRELSTRLTAGETD
jgi:hypothetical protein